MVEKELAASAPLVTFFTRLAALLPEAPYSVYGETGN